MSTSEEDWELQIQKEMLCSTILVKRLSRHNHLKLAKDFCQRNIISHDMKEKFASVDDGIESEILVRYLLSLAIKNRPKTKDWWKIFFKYLKEIGEVKLYEIFKSTVEPMNLDDVGTTFSEVDINVLVSVLSPIKYKWDSVGVVLGFSESEIEECRDITDNGISLFKILAHWINQDLLGPKTLKRLQELLRSEVLGEGRLASDLPEKFRMQKLLYTASTTTFKEMNDTCIKNSGDIEVCDGKTALFWVSANSQSLSYKWLRNDDPLVNNSTYTGVGECLLIVSRASQGLEGIYKCVLTQGNDEEIQQMKLEVKYSPVKKCNIEVYKSKKSLPFGNIFVPLTLTCRLNVSEDFSSHRDTEIRHYNEVFGSFERSGLTLVTGSAGCGKTTLLERVAKDWASGRALKYCKNLYLINFSKIKNEPSRKVLFNMLSAVGKYTEGVLNEEIADIEKNIGEGVCFVIDGFDGYLYCKRYLGSNFSDLLNKEYLPSAMIVVSCQPSDISSINCSPSRIVEVVGFNDDQISMFLKKFPFKSSNCAAVKEYVLSNRSIHKMFKQPLLATMISTIFDSGDHNNLDSNEFAVCQQIIKLRMKRSNGKEIEGWKRWLEKIEGFKELCQMAFIMSTHCKKHVTMEMLNELGFQSLNEDTLQEVLSWGILKRNEVVPDATYEFIHDLFQDMLAAYHIASLDTNDRIEVIQEYLDSYIMNEKSESVFSESIKIWQFCTGLIKIDTEDELHFFKCITNGTNDTERMYFALYDQKGELAKYICDENNHFSFDNLSISDMKPLNKALAIATNSDTRLSVSSANFSIIQSERLTQLKILVMEDEISKVQEVLTMKLKFCKHLQFLSVKLGEVGIGSVRNFVDSLKGLVFLQRLQISFLSQCDGISTILDDLRHLQKDVFVDLSIENIATINISDNKFSISSVRNLSFLQISNCNSDVVSLFFAVECDDVPTLEALNLSSNNLSGLIQSISAGLKSLKHLRRLDLSYNGFLPRDAEALGQVLKNLTELTHLNLAHNKIGEGAVELAEGLGNFVQLKEFSIIDNEMDIDSIKYIIWGLPTNGSYKANVGLSQVKPEIILDCVPSSTGYKIFQGDTNNYEIFSSSKPDKTNIKWNFCIVFVFIIIGLVIFWLKWNMENFQINEEL